ncbi:UNVERIFIED_CONTAM: Retrovirus-related Pol polyprotein from transposon RE2 [Sesamum indicum]
MHQKAYKLFDLDSRSVLFSRDVQFYEGEFPFSQNDSSSDSSPSLPLVSLDVDAVLSPSSLVSPQPVVSQSPHSQHMSPLPSIDASTRAVSPVPRRSNRISRKPIWLEDFISNVTNSCIIHPCNAAYTYFVASMSIFQEPKSYHEAMQHQEWLDAMKTEITTLENNHTWSLVPLPAGKKPIGCKWFGGKVQSSPGAKGFSQIAGVDYTDNFSPIAKLITVRVLLAVAAAYGWPLHQMDVNNAFLHGYLEEDLYMEPPEGYSVQPGLVCKLERSLYGLKQASRQWNVELTLKLTDFGFSQLAYDHCLFTKTTDIGLVALLVYVDDIVVTAPSLELIQSVKTYLHVIFWGSKLLATLMVSILLRPILFFRLALNLVGTVVLYFHNRINIDDSLADYCIWAALHVVRYLKGEPSKGLFFLATCSFELTAYCDADWASCTDSRRSLTGYCIFLGDALVSWKTKKQSTVSRSTAEAEYRSMASTVCKLKWLSYLLSDFGIKLSLPVRLFCDNQAALHIMAKPVFHELSAASSSVAAATAACVDDIELSKEDDEVAGFFLFDAG